MSNSLQPMQGCDAERLRRWDERDRIARDIEEVVATRDASRVWPYTKGLGREAYQHAIRLVRAGIDLDAPDIYRVRAEVCEYLSRVRDEIASLYAD